MQSFAEFLAMGGYAAYVWPAYGVALLIVGWMVISSVRASKTAKRLLARQDEG